MFFFLVKASKVDKRRKRKEDTVDDNGETSLVSQSIQNEDGAECLPSTSQQQHQLQQPLKKRKAHRRKKVPIQIGHDLHGNPIIAYRKPYANIVHLPPHIQTPELMETVNQQRATSIHTNSHASSQYTITNGGDLLRRATNTSGNNQSTATIFIRQPKIVKQNTSTMLN